MEYSTVTKWNDGFHFTTHFDGRDTEFDATAMPGPHKGVSPKTMLLSALAGCTGMDVVALLNQKFKVPFTDFSVDVNGLLTDTHPKIFHAIHIKYIIRVSEEDRDKVAQSVSLSATKYCGVQAMLNKSSEITNEIIYL